MKTMAVFERLRLPANLRSGAVDLIVVDSVAALTPKAEIEGEMGDQFVGLQARMMSQALRIENQIREASGIPALPVPAELADATAPAAEASAPAVE